jgi:hypothetical protein
MKLSKKFALLASVALLLSLFPRPAYACSCAPPGTPLETLAAATAVFTGEVVAVEAPGPVIGVISSADPVKITFQVQVVWKGPVEQVLTLTNPREDASCGYSFEMGKLYLVYAFGHESSLQTHLCTRNQPLAAAAEDLSALGQGSVPSAPGWDLIPTLAALLVLVAAATAAGAILYRRKRPSS